MMTTAYDALVIRRIAASRERLDHLKAMGAPAILLRGEEQALELAVRDLRRPAPWPGSRRQPLSKDEFQEPGRSD